MTASGLHDVFETPFSADRRVAMPGVQIHAAMPMTSCRTVSSSRRQPGSAWHGSRHCTARRPGATFMPAWWATAVTVVVITLVGGAAFWLFGRGYWLNSSQPAWPRRLALFGGVAYRYFVEAARSGK